MDCGVHFRLNFDSLGEPNIFLVTCLSDVRAVLRDEMTLIVQK